MICNQKMIKKAIVLAATAFFSLNASAGYVQYDFSGPVSGFFVQHDDDLSIAYYSFSVPYGQGPTGSVGGLFHPMSGDGVDINTAATTHFRRNGPTNFSVFDNYGSPFPGMEEAVVKFDFSRSTGGEFSYSADFTARLAHVGLNGWETWPFSGRLTGSLTATAADPSMTAYFDSVGGYDDGVNGIVPIYIGPNKVPEPASLALFAVGALGAIGALRHRKHTS